MNINVSDIQQARIKRDSFLKMNYKPLQIIAESSDDVYYIYMIEIKLIQNIVMLEKLKTFMIMH